MGVLDEHHKILKQINTTDKKMSDKIFDYVLCLSSGDQSKPKDSEQYSKMQNKSVNASMLNVTEVENDKDLNERDFQSEEWDLQID